MAYHVHMRFLATFAIASIAFLTLVWDVAEHRVGPETVLAFLTLSFSTTFLVALVFRTLRGHR